MTEQTKFHSCFVSSGPNAGQILLQRIRQIQDEMEFIQQVCRMCGVMLHEIRAPDHTRRASEVRDMCAALLYSRGYSWPEVARILNREYQPARRAAMQFFDRDMRQPFFAEAWRVLAHCVFAGCRTYEDLMIVANHRWEMVDDAA